MIALARRSAQYLMEEHAKWSPDDFYKRGVARTDAPSRQPKKRRTAVRADHLE